MSPLDQLLAETIPTRPGPAPRWTPEEQDAHWAALCEAVGVPGTPRPNSQQKAA